MHRVFCNSFQKIDIKKLYIHNTQPNVHVQLTDNWEGSLFLSSGLLEHDVVLAISLALVFKPATTFSRASNRFDTSSTIFTTLFCDSRREESILSLEGAATARCIRICLNGWWVE